MKLSETTRAGGFIVSEANGYRSRDKATLAAGENLPAGAVLGEVTASPGTYAEHDPDASDGTETAAAVLYDAVDATDGALPCVVVIRDAEIDTQGLTFIAGISAPNQTAALAALKTQGLIAR